MAVTGTFTLATFLRTANRSTETSPRDDWEHARRIWSSSSTACTRTSFSSRFSWKPERPADASGAYLTGLMRQFISLTNVDRIVLVEDSGVVVADERAGVPADGEPPLPPSWTRGRSASRPTSLSRPRTAAGPCGCTWSRARRPSARGGRRATSTWSRTWIAASSRRSWKRRGPRSPSTSATSLWSTPPTFSPSIPPDRCGCSPCGSGIALTASTRAPCPRTCGIACIWSPCAPTLEEAAVRPLGADLLPHRVPRHARRFPVPGRGDYEPHGQSLYASGPMAAPLHGQRGGAAARRSAPATRWGSWPARFTPW